VDEAPDSPRFARVGADRSAAPPPRASVAIGFGSPAGDTGVTRLDLNDMLIRNAQATFFMRVAGDAMREAGLASGDIVLVDRALAPLNGHVVIATVEHEFVCRRLARQGSTVRLAAADGSADIVPREGEELQVWGVVTTVIKQLPV
jgi:DNA polymerase V